MKLSLASVKICEQRFGQGSLHGFEQAGEITVDTLSDAESKRVTNELADSEWLMLYDNGVHISALGQHNLNMMIDPDVFIELDNSVLQTNVKIYIRNAYYLYVMEDKKASAANDSNELIIELLPTLKEVVGSFVYALYREKADDAETAEKAGRRGQPDIQVTAQAWNRKTGASTSVDWCADYCGVNALRMVNENQTNDEECDVCDFVNQLTMWMFDRLSEIVEKEVVVREEK